MVQIPSGGKSAVAAALFGGQTVPRPYPAAFTAIRESGGIDPDWKHDRTLHRIIAAASGNHRLSSEISRYGEVIQSVREIVGEQSYGIHETTADEHLAILEAIRQGDADAAASAMKAHL